jgi:hypothetical protein
MIGDSGPRVGVADSSIFINGGRRLSRASAAAARRFVGWYRETNRRIGVGLRRGRGTAPRSSAQIDALFADSRIVRAIVAFMTFWGHAWQHAVAKRAIDDLLALDLGLRCRLLGQMLLAAVVTHVVVLAALRVPVFMLGWSLRAVLALLALALILRPDVFASAWKDRASRRT